MPLVKIKSLNKTIQIEKDQSLMTVLIQNDVFIDNPCNGKGTCGKCKVKIVSSTIKSPCKEELKMLSEEDLNNFIRLSCFIYPKDDIAVEVIKKENKTRILTTGITPKFKFNPAFLKKNAVLDKADLKNQVPFEERLKLAFKTHTVDWRLLTNISTTKEELTGIFYENKLVSLKSYKNASLYGIAVDIGTTTVIASIVDLETGKELASASMINPQKKYGLDVLTRITYAMENPEYAKDELQKAIINGLNELINELIKKTDAIKKEIYEIVISGNTTMLHFLMGVDSRVIGKAPYAPVFIKSKKFNAREIGIEAGDNTLVYCMPSVSSYIGADIVSGSYVCGLHKKEKTTLFIDIGTNGEIVLAHNGKLSSCSCAAGPALEGMNISGGMRAQNGAIEEISISKTGIQTKVIGETKGIGLCGSGILAVLREMIKNEIVTKSGAIIKLDKLDKNDYRRKFMRLDGKKRELVISSKKEPIIVTQSDIRQVQLAKGAILSGFYALLNNANIQMKDLDEVIVAGQFGAHLSVESLIGTGILPKEVRNKLNYIGNASKTGAYMALMSMEVRREIEALASRIDYIELSTVNNYERLFAQCLLFK